MLRMSKLTDYGIVLLANLARGSEKTLLTAQELANTSRIPLPTVSKLLKVLTRAKLVVSHRGRRGGYGLARSADAISVAEIIGALEGPIGLTECSEEIGSCNLESVCLARGSWGPISRVIQGALEGMSLSALSLPNLPVLTQIRRPKPAPNTPGVHS